MTNEVIWTKLVLERFIQLANLTEEEEIVIRTRAAGWSRVKQAMELNISISGIDRIISRLRKKYDEVWIQSVRWMRMRRRNLNHFDSVDKMMQAEEPRRRK